MATSRSKSSKSKVKPASGTSKRGLKKKSALRSRKAKGVGNSPRSGSVRGTGSSMRADATHPSAFVTPQAMSDFGVLLGDDAIPFVPFVLGLQSSSSEQQRLPQEIVAAIALSLYSTLGLEEYGDGAASEGDWALDARRSALSTRF